MVSGGGNVPSQQSWGQAGACRANAAGVAVGAAGRGRAPGQCQEPRRRGREPPPHGSASPAGSISTRLRAYQHLCRPLTPPCRGELSFGDRELLRASRGRCRKVPSQPEVLSCVRGNVAKSWLGALGRGGAGAQRGAGPPALLCRQSHRLNPRQHQQITFQELLTLPSVSQTAWGLKQGLWHVSGISCFG